MEDRFIQGRKKAMALLNHKDRTEWELRERMKKNGFEAEVIEDAVAYVESFHYIDDKRYAVRFAEIYCESRSIKRMIQDMKKRHIPEEYIEFAMEQISWDDSAALEKEWRRGCKPGVEWSYEEKQKVAARLYRKGFRSEDILRKLDA